MAAIGGVVCRDSVAAGVHMLPRAYLLQIRTLPDLDRRVLHPQKHRCLQRI
jgi:hypothetical protein